MSTNAIALTTPSSIAASAPRWLLGTIFFVFGLNGFLQFLPAPPLPESAGAFLGALAGSGYFFPVLKGTEVLAGLALLSGIGAPVALVVLAPISIQIFLFHFFFTPGLGNQVLPLVIVAAHLAAAVRYWHLYRPLFQKV
ncbi:MAG TPA: acyltransferase [Bdellovibrionota bacterium]|nr:acyltransferase [Bdellovibrionota bacterium]